MSPWRAGTICRHYEIAPHYRTPRPSWWCVAGWVAFFVGLVLIVAMTA
ncbi:MAG: hypothetical protein AB7K86_08450 [Rhodospirillales bacterium]